MATFTIGQLEKVRALAANGPLLAIGGARAGTKSQITLFDSAAKKTLRTLDVPSHVLSLGFVGNVLLAGCADGFLRSYDSSTGAPGKEQLAHAGGVFALAVSSDGLALATAGADGTAKQWSASSLSPGSVHQLSTQPLRAVAITSTTLAAAGDDGVVRVVNLQTFVRREMPGHQGPVFALRFTPRDGRLASAGDDGTIRLWFLDGAVEAEIRGANEQGHAGGTFAICFSPIPAAPVEAPDRLFSTGADSKVKVWRLDERRKPKSFDLIDFVRALAVVTPGTPNELGMVVAAGDARTLVFIPIGPDGAPAEATHTGEHGLRVLEAQSAGPQKPGREAAARTLAQLEEPEALALLLKMLANDKEPDVRGLVAQLLGQHGRRDARPALRERLDDSHDKVRAAALAALQTLETDNPVAALRAGLKSKQADIRAASVRQLPPLYPASPLVPALVSATLTDADATVRLAALDALTKLHPAGSFEPLKIAFERGPADLRAEAMVRGLMLGKAIFPGVWWMTGRALDDADGEVRRLGFAVRVLTRGGLAAILQHRYGDFGRTVKDVLRRVAIALRTAPGKEVSDAEITAARAAIGLVEGSAEGDIDEAEFEPLLLAMSCRTSDTSLRGTVALLSLVEDRRAVGALLQLSRDASPGIRAHVVGILCKLTHAQAEQRIVAMLEDSEGAVRAAAADAWAERTKPRPIEFASGLLHSAFEDMRVRGLATLTQLPADGRKDAEVLLEAAIEDESAKVRAEAFRTLWAWHPNEPKTAIDRGLSARFPDVRLKAVDELNTIAQTPRDDEAKPPAAPAAWAVERLEKTVADRTPAVGLKAFESVRRLTTAAQPKAYLLALASSAPEVRRAGSAGAGKADRSHGEALRSPLLKALADDDLTVRLGALESVDVLFPDENGPLTAGLTSDALEVKVRAGELLARRHAEIIIEPLRGILLDKTLVHLYPPQVLAAMRERAAGALATLGSPRVVSFAANTLLKDEQPGVREQAARALCNAGEPDKVGPLLDALGHADVWVRSWAAEGLARLGDPRGLSVLTGTLRDPHFPIREGAIRSTVALGHDADRSLLTGLDDPDRRLQDTFFAVVLARDWKAYRHGQPPELLIAALSSQRAEIRFAAARALEQRTDAEPSTSYLVDVLMPAKPEKVADMKDWPAEGERVQLMISLADQLSAESALDRYSAGQALLLRSRPLEYFAEVRRVTKLRAADTAVVPDTTPRAPAAAATKGKADWLRRLFASHTKGGAVAEPEQAQLKWLAFGAYVGIVREAVTEESGHRVRRDSIDRIVALGQAGQPPASSAVPPLVRALDDGDHLVRRQAYAGLKRLFGEDTTDTAIKYAISSASADVAKTALDELAARGESSKPLITTMMNGSIAEVRKHAFELLVRLSPSGSLDPLLAAFSCQHSDLRLGVVERLAASTDARVTDALIKALESEHEDLRLRAAELLADRRDERAVAVLAGFLRGEDEGPATKARTALTRLHAPAAVQALAARLDEVTTTALRMPLIKALEGTRGAGGLDALIRLVTEEEVDVAAFEAGLKLVNFWRPDPDEPEANAKKEKETPRDDVKLLELCTAAVRSKNPVVRLAASQKMDVAPNKGFDALLKSMFGDRAPEVRIDAVTRYGTRVEKHGADAAVLEELLRQGARELMLPAAEGLSHKKHPSAYRPLLLMVRAGEAGERERALKALGTQGDVRCVEELETVASGGTLEIPFEPSMQAAALEGLGRLFPALVDAEQKRPLVGASPVVPTRDHSSAAARVWERLEVAASEGAFVLNGIEAVRVSRAPRAIPTLERLALQEGLSPAFRTLAIRALGTMGDVSAEPTLASLLKASALALRQAAKVALTRLFPTQPMRVALLGVDSPYGDVAAPAIAFLVAEAEPASLLERLALPLTPALRDVLRLGLVRRPTLPTASLVSLTEANLPATREDVAWVMGLHALTGAVPAAEMASRAKALAAAAMKTAERWAKSLGTDRAAEERAWRRLLWAAVLHTSKDVVPVAASTLASGAKAPAVIRREAARALGRAGGTEAVAALSVAATDLDVSVRRSAMAGLAKLDPAKARSLINAVTPLDAVAFAPAGDAQLLKTESGRQVQLPASIGTGAQTTELMRLAKDGETDLVKLAALAALGRIGGDDVIAFLESLAITGEGGDEGEDEEEPPEEDEEEEEGDDEEEEEEERGADDITLNGGKRYEFEEDDSSKFWEYAVEGNDFKVRFGKIGTKGQIKLKTLASPAAAQKEAEKMVREKTGKGYAEVKPKGRKALAVAKPTPAPAEKVKPAAKEIWGTEELRMAAYRALRRAQRVTERKKGAPAWFSPEQLKQLAAGVAIAPAPVTAVEPDDDDEGDEDEDYDEDEE